MIRETRGRVWEGGLPGHILDKFLQIWKKLEKFRKSLENFGRFWKKYVHNDAFYLLYRLYYMFTSMKIMRFFLLEKTRGRGRERHPGHILDKFLKILENFGNFRKFRKKLDIFLKVWKIFEKICTHWCSLFALSTILIDIIDKKHEIVFLLVYYS